MQTKTTKKTNKKHQKNPKKPHKNKKLIKNINSPLPTAISRSHESLLGSN